MVLGGGSLGGDIARWPLARQRLSHVRCYGASGFRVPPARGGCFDVAADPPDAADVHYHC